MGEMDKTYNDKNLAEEKVSSKEIFKGVLLHVFQDTVKLPNGNETLREYITHNGAVCIIPITDDGRVIMERQFRYPVRKVISEIPAGKLESKEEDQLEAAKRELMEETGYTADTWIDMGWYMGAPAYTDEGVKMFMAKGLKKGDRHLDDDEFLNVYTESLDTLFDLVMKGEIKDGKTIVAVLKVKYMLDNEK